MLLRPQVSNTEEPNQVHKRVLQVMESHLYLTKTFRVLPLKEGCRWKGTAHRQPHGSQQAHEFPGVPATNHKNWVTSNNTNLFSHNSACQKFRFKVLARSVPSGDYEGESVLCLSLSFWCCWQPLAFLGLWLHHSSLAPIVTWPFSLWISVFQISLC